LQTLILVGLILLYNKSLFLSRGYLKDFKKFLPEYLENTLAGSRNTISRSSAYFEKETGNAGIPILSVCKKFRTSFRLSLSFFPDKLFPAVESAVQDGNGKILIRHVTRCYFGMV